MEFMESPIVRVAAALIGGIALVVVANTARGLPDRWRGSLRLELGNVSFMEIFGIFLIGYAIGALVAGPSPDAPGGPPRPGIGGRFGFLTRGGATPVTFAFGLAFLAFLWRYDLLGRLTNPQSHKSVAAIIGSDAEAMEDIPAGGHGQIRFRDPGGTLVGVMAASDVEVARGSWVRIVGTKGLNPLVVPKHGTKTSR
jgi:membrane protein implicated in regulation of membrane protease activity